MKERMKERKKINKTQNLQSKTEQTETGKTMIKMEVSLKKHIHISS
jgi:hypothetical protein